MSARAMGMVMDRYPAIHGEFKLAVALANFASEDGRNIYPSVETMAAKSRQDVRSVQRHLKRMLEIGWLLMVRAGGGRGRPAIYRINPRWMAGEDLPLADGEKGDTVPGFSQKKRVTPVSKKGDTDVAAYKNLKEPNTPLPPTLSEASFEALAAEYPKHRCNLRAARREWAKLDPDESLQRRIVASAAQQAKRADWQAEEGRRVPNLSKWLADEGWRITHHDEKPETQTAATSKVHVAPPELTDDERALQRQIAEEARARARTLVRELKEKAVLRDPLERLAGTAEGAIPQSAKSPTSMPLAPALSSTAPSRRRSQTT